jgi:hypothetical protein
MLWAFFDESGWHASREEGGRLKKLTVGGCIASFDSWECLSLEWSSALAAMNLPCFHMADFENRQPPHDPAEGQTKYFSGNSRREGPSLLRLHQLYETE